MLLWANCHLSKAPEFTDVIVFKPQFKGHINPNSLGFMMLNDEI